MAFPRIKKYALAGLVLVLATFFNGLAAARPYGTGKYGTCSYGTNSCTISIASSQNVNISTHPSSSSVYSIARDQLNIITDNYAGYTVSVETQSLSSNNLENQSNTISPVSGTPASPSALSLNSWGWRIDGQSGFGAGPTSTVTDASVSTLTFAAVPMGGSPVQIYSSGSPSASPGGDNIDIWYGVRVDGTQTAGSYQQIVVYTAVAQP